MKVAIMQPYFFPYIGYFQLINSVDKFIIYDDLNFIKKKWINRNRILIKNIGPDFITVPLLDKSSSRKISETLIDDSQNWRDKLKKTIRMNYKKARMFNEVFPFIEQIIDYKTDRIAELNFNLIKSICQHVHIKTLIDNESPIYSDLEKRLSDPGFITSYYPGLDVKTARILDICKKENADTYHNAAGGMSLYSPGDFSRYGIELRFIKTKPFKYMQFSSAFFPDLSIIDVLMFNSPEEINSLLANFELV